MPSYTTEHYVFTYKEGSFAAKDIRKVAKIQEKCFAKICNTLKVDFTEKINYFLLGSKVSNKQGLAFFTSKLYNFQQ